MRLLTLAPSASLLLLVVAPSVIRAQFQEPTKEELAMTADAKAPGAGYIYLYREHIDNESDSIRSFYDRIKILTEKGKEAATIRIPYFPSTEKFPVIEGRTIHADGTVVPLDVKPDDLVDIKTKDYQADTIVFTLPSAEVGSIL